MMGPASHLPPQMTEHVTLREHVTTSLVALSSAEATALTDADVSVVAVTGSPGLYDVRPGSTVGVVRVGRRQFDIVPKIGIRRLLHLLTWSERRIRWHAGDLAGYRVEDQLVEVLAGVYARHLDRALARGVVRDYRHVEERGLTVRGRIDLATQIRREHGRLLPINVEYDDHTVDTDPNRLLLAAALRLRGVRVRSATTRRLLVRALDRLDGVSAVRHHSRDLPRARITRLNAHYEPSLSLARLVLQARSIETGGTDSHADALLFDMNEVFEDFVVHALREKLGLSPATFPRNDGRLRLDEARRVRLEPDLNWIEDGHVIFVGDVKYKRVDVRGVKHPDLYQVHAYARAAGLPSALLVYAKGEGEPVMHDVVLDGPRIEVAAIDLDRDLEGLDLEIGRIADRVRRHAEIGRHHRHAKSVASTTVPAG